MWLQGRKGGPANLFSNLFGGLGSNQAAPKFKFTFEELRSLYSVLQRNPVVKDHNRAVVVETIRSVAEFILWGDQNEPKIFEFFLENNVMLYMHNILLQPENRRGDVAKQVLQTLSIIIQNVRSETATFFLFSNNHINNILEVQFDFEDEEVMGYFISFLKSISLQLNPRTVQFFVNVTESGVKLPLLTEAVKFANNPEGMVRAGVRTLALKVLTVQDPSIQEFLTTSPTAAAYYSDVAKYVAEQVHALDKRLAAARASMQGHAMGALDGQLAEIEDIVTYCNDVISTGGANSALAHQVATQLWTHVAGPHLFRPLLEMAASSCSSSSIPAAAADGLPNGSSGRGAGPPESSSSASTDASVQCALYMLERIFQWLTYTPLLHNILFVLFGAAYMQQGGSSSPESTQPQQASCSCRQGFMACLTGDNAVLAAACLRMLVAAVNNKHADPRVMYTLGLMPKAQFEIRDLGTGQKEDVFSSVAPGAAQSNGAPALTGAETRAGVYKFTYQMHFPCLQSSSKLAEPPTATSHKAQPTASDSSAAADAASNRLQAALGGLVDGLQAAEPAPQEDVEMPPRALAADETAAGGTSAQGQDAFRNGATDVAATPGTSAPAEGKSSIGSTARTAAEVSPLQDNRLQVLQPAGSSASAHEGIRASLLRSCGGSSAAELLDALLGLLLLPALPQPSLCLVGYLLQQLAQPNMDTGLISSAGPAYVLTPSQQQALQAALLLAHQGLVDTVSNMWGEAILPLICVDWPLCLKSITKPSLVVSSDALLAGHQMYDDLMFYGAGTGSSQAAAPAAAQGLGRSGMAALHTVVAVQRAVVLAQLQQLLVRGAISEEAGTPHVTDEQLKKSDIGEGQLMELAPGSAIPCAVSFAPGQERRVQYAVSGVQPMTGSLATLAQSTPVVVLAELVPGRVNTGSAVAVAPLLGADPYVDSNVGKWLHVHVRPSVRGLVRVVRNGHSRKGGVLAALRHLADGHWVLAFPDAEKATNARALTEQYTAKLRALYCSALEPLMLTGHADSSTEAAHVDTSC